jgi:O-antigen/teichoic acid export membrane protein
MYYVFLSLGALVPLMDLGFIVAVNRAVAYAMAGAKELRAQGIVPSESQHARPNHELIWHLLRATRILYRWLSALAFLLLGLFGTVVVGLRVAETDSPPLTWVAWGATLMSGVWEVYASWWGVFLLSLNRVVRATQLNFLAYLVKLVLGCVLLLCGADLLSLPLAGLFAGLLHRALARRECLQVLAEFPRPSGPTDVKALLGKLWPNSWRQGLVTLSTYLSTNANALICLKVFGLAANAQFGLSTQIIAISQGMATVWTDVKWPLVFQLRTRQDHPGLRQMLWARVWLQIITFSLLAALAVAFGPTLLQWLGSEKKLLPVPWLVALAAQGLLDMQFSFWTCLLCTENRVPSLRATVVTSLASVVLVLSLVHFSSLGVPSLILGPLLARSIYNYWYWPLAGARSLRSTLLRFMLKTHP